MKRLFLLGFSFFLLMSSWEGQLTMANVLDNGPIPQESIRLRIIANSDSFQDQWLKREVRDALIDKMNSWSGEIESFEQAQQVVAAKLPELQQVVDETIRSRGFAYPAVVEFGDVPFPTKLYGSYVYPAGEYKAVRVSIGEAQGQNWWCVLFPPLCFIDMSNGDAVQASATPSEKIASTISDSRQDWQDERISQRDRLRFQDNGEDTIRVQESEDSVTSKEATPATDETTPGVEVRFFFWERLERLFS
ncbi:stage II sporulation protein R [Brevibacillus sp. TJ4]|uniref:stage II sporulation protein R n=1 Tax=Brevibacillus sp. TJ4 TaxID=3234853 RepID=UPI0037CD459A